MTFMLLMRHADYDTPKYGEDDTPCPLSMAGEAQAEAKAQELIKQDLIPNEIGHSGKARTEQTAQILKAAFEKASGKKISLILIPDLNPGDTDADRLLRHFNEKSEIVMAITSQPNISDLCWQLVRKTVEAEMAQVFVLEVPADRSRALRSTARLNQSL